MTEEDKTHDLQVVSSTSCLPFISLYPPMRVHIQEKEPHQYHKENQQTVEHVGQR